MDDKFSTTIYSLPNELISMILVNNNYREILWFGATCKRFNEMVNNDHSLWRPKLQCMLPTNIYDIVMKHGNGKWLFELKAYFKLKHKIFNELICMSPQYYWRKPSITYEDLRNYFTYALSSNKSYYYTTYILQEFIKRGQKNVNEYNCVKVITLTEMYYGKVAQRHLMHTYLALKWVKAHIQDELSPEIVINFFLQWIDTDKLHLDDDVQDKIAELAKNVETILISSRPTKMSENIREQCENGQISERQILTAVGQVLHQHRRMAVTSVVNVDTLNIVKVLDDKYGNVIVVAAVYQALAKRFGVKCELIAFPNHLFLEWKDKSDCRVYTINLETGELHPKRRCPFSQSSQNTRYKYYPDSLLQYIHSAFHMSMGAIKNWQTENALLLLDFLGTNEDENNPYRNFLPYLLDLSHESAMNTPLNFKYLDDVHLQILSSLSNLNTTYKVVNRNFDINKRDSRLKFAVGMICCHKKYDYVCIIRGWDLDCAVKWQRRMGMEPLEFGPTQPFYHVTAADQSERYVAQENLTEVTHPTRLYHLEDLIARGFSHFDGFGYVPNDEMKMEYPDDEAIRYWFRSRCMLKRTNATNYQ